MKPLPILPILCLLPAIFPEGIAAAQTLPAFRKLELSDQFYSEGATFGDFNGDGKGDVASGPYWYEGPDFETRHELYEPREFDPRKYSDCFFMFAHDFDRDGWEDLLVVGFPGKPAHWLKNPGEEGGHWPRHLAAPDVGNESPVLADITGDGQPELVYNTGTHLGYARYDPDRPVDPWRFVAVSPSGKWNKFTHGLGYGDVNGDGRIDLITHHGWWEQPESLEDDPEWELHQVDLGRGAQMFAYDVNGDNRSDLITSLDAHGWGLAWFQQQAEEGGVSFKRHVIMGEHYRDSRYGVRFSQLHALALSDMDGDGHLDIVTGKRFWAHGPEGDPEPNAPAVLYWFKTVPGEDGGVDFLPFPIDSDSGVGTQVVTGDVSGNGFSDVVVGNKKGTFLFLNEPVELTDEEWEKARPRVIQYHR